MQHESEILPFPNTEKSFSLPDDIIQEVKEGELDELSLSDLQLVDILRFQFARLLCRCVQSHT